MLGLQESIDIVIDGIKTTIEKAPPEIAADIAANGMVLSGGGGMIYNLNKLRRQIGRASLGKECRSRWSPYH